MSTDDSKYDPITLLFSIYKQSKYGTLPSPKEQDPKAWAVVGIDDNVFLAHLRRKKDTSGWKQP